MDQEESGATGRAAAQASSEEKKSSTQNTQYDQIGTEYLKIKTLPAAEPEVPSILKVLEEGEVRGARCLDLACGTGKYTHLLHTLGASSVTGYDISSTMIQGAVSTYPPSQYSSLHFGIADCSIPSSLPSSNAFDLVFSAWFLNYAGTEQELTNMFRVIESQMKQDARFVGLTTNAHDVDMHIPKPHFYGLDVEVLDPAYEDPDTHQLLGIKARVKVGGGQAKGGFEFDVFHFRKEVYERCAREARLRVQWRGVVVPDDERKESGFWDGWLARPTFCLLEARRVEG